MSTAKHDFTDDYEFTQGDTWRFSLRVCTDDVGAVGRDLTGLTPHMQIRKTEIKTATLILNFPEAASPLTGITVRGDQTDEDDAGWLDFYASSVDTADIKSGVYWYDVELRDGGDPPDVDTFIEGQFAIGNQVTV